MSVKVRKGQLISTFGPGAMMVDARGVSVMTAGLDHWYREINNLDTYRLEDPRLAERLNVDHFRVPPDPRAFNAQDSQNADRGAIGGVRFPRWHVCSNMACQQLQREGYGMAGASRCRKCGARAYQSRFVVVCRQGHIDDFPWSQWVHRSASPVCEGRNMRLLSVGNSSLSGMKVECRDCRKTRTLSGITQVDGEGSYLGMHLCEEGYTCSGNMPWLGDHHEPCDQQPIGMLRQSTNVHFARLVSSIHLPMEAEGDAARVMDLLEGFGDQTTLDILKAVPDQERFRMLKSLVSGLGGFPEELVMRTFASYMAGAGEGGESSQLSGLGEDIEQAYRSQERVLLLNGVMRGTLRATPMDLSGYEEWVADYFGSISLVERLTETRALLGFDRYEPSRQKEVEDYQKQLFRSLPGERSDRWLPAAQVFGEGLYFEFRADGMQAWEESPRLESRVRPLNDRLMENAMTRRELISARFLMVHTFAHLLMNRLVYDCGYSSASLRERLYVSADPENPMAGLLVYTASGDSEGSLGGLVRMGLPGELERIVLEALREALWCSSDPVCTETGRGSGQGPGSLNLAACHSCALVPETSCEEFNLFLDRSCVISHERRGLGYFDNLREV